MKPFRDPYLRPSQIKKIIYASTCLWALGGTLALAAPGQSWQPRLSEKILMLPPQQIERAVESDYKASPLAAELQDLDGQIAQSVSTTETLMEMRSTISAEESIELRHQIISSKRDYVKLMGEKLGKNKERLQSKMAVYNKLLRQAERQNRRNGGSVNVASLQENARERAAKVQLRVDEGLALMNYQQPTKNSTAYARNLDAIDAIRAAIAEHPMQAHMPLSDISDQPKALQEMIAQVEIDLSLIALEEELLGHMAQLLALDAMALAEDVDADMAMADDRLVTNELSLSSQAFNLFTD